MTKSRRILLLTDVFPCYNYSWALMSSQLCRFLLDSKQEIFCACVHHPDIKDRSDDYLSTKIPRLDFVKPEENSDNTDAYNKEVKKISQKIIKYIKENNLDTVWCPLQGETLLKILNSIQKNTENLRIVAQIWDPFSWILHDLNYSEPDQKSLLKLFNKVIGNCDSVITASKPMNKLYEKTYKIPCSPVFTSYSLPENLSEKPLPYNEKITIIISGQTYATKGINSLLEALDLMDWSFGGKEIIIKYFGSNPETFSDYKDHVVLGGYVTQAELVNAQQNADLLYCSYYFDDPALDIVSKQSYPSKIITYIASGTPILVHSEEYCPVYQDFKKYNCGYLLSSTDKNLVKAELGKIFSAGEEKRRTIIENSIKLFNDNFTSAQNKKSFFKALKIPYSPFVPTHILEINNVDLPGHIWNGYDLMNYINEETPDIANQICTYKTSDKGDVVRIYTNPEQELEYKLLAFEEQQLSVHSCLSSSSPILMNKKVYQTADLLHFHLIHNMKLSLFSLIELCNEKPSVVSIHDPWTFTGHCVHFGDCRGYLKNCNPCPYLDIMFPIKFDTAHELWGLKKYVYDRIDVDYVVSTKYMYDLFKSSPLTKDKRVHLIPFGIDINKFNTISKKEAREKYNIPKDHIVLFHRAQEAFKGTNFFVDALKQLSTTEKITIITCSETGLLDEIKNKYRLIELGNIEDDELTYAYNACDILIMPSIGESFGMMAVEAMSCGKPVICFNNTALPSVTFAPDCGIAVENLNSTKLMEAIKLLVENKDERERRGALAKKIVRENYDVKLYNEKMTNLYKEALERKHNFKKLETPKEIENTPDTLTLKYKLNLLTKQIFPYGSEERGLLTYDLKNLKIDKDLPIKYSSPNIQFLLDQYNKDVVKFYDNFIARGEHYTPVTKLLHFVKLFFFLLTHDRKKLLIVIKKRLGIRKNG